MKKLLFLGIISIIFVSSCKKDDLPANAVKDINGNVYHTLTIGTQVWMVENLKVTKYRDGTVIPIKTDATEWSNLTTGAYCYYNNIAGNNATYGKLYNWYAVNDKRNIAPAGWHVPTDDDWATLENYLATHTGTSGSVAKSLATTTNWITSSNAGAIGNDLSKNNSSGFSGLPGGYRHFNGTFYTNGSEGYWWSSTGNNTGEAYDRDLGYNLSTVNKSYFSDRNGFSVRCIKD